MLVFPVSASPTTVAAGGAREPAARDAPPPAAMPAATEAAGSATSPFAVRHLDPALEARMASLRARLLASFWERGPVGPPPAFSTSVLDALRKELQTRPLDRLNDAPQDASDADRLIGQEPQPCAAATEPPASPGTQSLPRGAMDRHL